MWGGLVCSAYMFHFQALEDAEKIAALMEESFCRHEGYMQQITSVEKLKLPEHHAIIEADALYDCEPDDVGASLKDMLDPKIARRLKKARDALKDKRLVERIQRKPKKPVKKLQVLLKKGKEKLKTMMKTTSRLEVLKKTLVEAGKGKTPKGLKEACKEEGDKVKSMKPIAGIAKLKACLSKKLNKGVKKKLKKKLKKNLKTKPCAKSKPSVHAKDSAVVKKTIKEVLKDVKKSMKKDKHKYAGKKWTAVKKELQKQKWKSKVHYILGLELCKLAHQVV